MQELFIDAKQILKSIFKIQEFPSEKVRSFNKLVLSIASSIGDFFSVRFSDNMYTLS